jgi:hypothetical protein
MIAMLTGIASGKGEWPMPARDNRLSAQAEDACHISREPKEVWSYGLKQPMMEPPNPLPGRVAGRLNCQPEAPRRPEHPAVSSGSNSPPPP